jgi:hypothetical protein
VQGTARSSGSADDQVCHNRIIASKSPRDCSAHRHICSKSAAREGRRPRSGAEIGMERSCPQSYSVARTDKAALQCVRGGSHGHGHHLALGQPDLIGPARIDPHDAGGNLVHLRFDAEHRIA